MLHTGNILHTQTLKN